MPRGLLTPHPNLPPQGGEGITCWTIVQTKGYFLGNSK